MYRMYRLHVPQGTESGYYIETSRTLTALELAMLRWLIAETFEPDLTSMISSLQPYQYVEIGPRLSIETPFSSNAVAICRAMGLDCVTRIERTRRIPLSPDAAYDRMTEQLYTGGIETFETGIRPAAVQVIDLIGRGMDELSLLNTRLGLGMDSADLAYYYHLFVDILQRNPTDVELLQLGNANSEHSRHWFFKGRIVIDGKVMPQTLLQIVQLPLISIKGDNRSLVAFHDNAGVIQGFGTNLLLPDTPGVPSRMLVRSGDVHITGTAETHNHPTFVSPRPGAETGAGGRIRDNSAVGRGGQVGHGVAGYFVGNLFLPGYQIPGEVVGRNQHSQYASPLEILIEGSNGVSSYGNQFGEPLTLGFCRTYGQVVGGEWREPRKPVLYSGGIGSVHSDHTGKEPAVAGMLIVRIGGPAYPIGIGGGAASSMMQGANTKELDYSSVQRGNAEMENRANRVITTCIELGDDNPICSIHDQGAGGPSNVLTELLEPLGGRIDIRKIVLGDRTMSVLQIWSAEFQEGYGLLIRPADLKRFQDICDRERVNCEVLGEIDGSGEVVLVDTADGTTPVQLPLEQILSNMPQKTFTTSRRSLPLEPLRLPVLSVAEALERVFKLPSVGSKGFLVHKVDRSVGGRVAQQQTCGIAQIPIGNVAVHAQGHFALTGSAAAVGEQPIKMLIDPRVGARMLVGEMLTNMAGVLITGLNDIRCRANWMWPAKLPYEGALLYDAASAMADLMIHLGFAIDGGKDSLSMAATVDGQLVKAPGSLVVLGYAPVADITRKVTPDIKKPGESLLALIDLGLGKNRLGGSAVAQAMNQLGDESPDVESAELLGNAFRAVQQMISEGLLLALHDRSDGGLITTVAEMCMASRCGFRLDVMKADEALAYLFNEELGFVLELMSEQLERILQICKAHHVHLSLLGSPTDTAQCEIISADQGHIFSSTITELRQWWEATSTELEATQANPSCASQAYAQLDDQLPAINADPSHRLSFNPRSTTKDALDYHDNPKVAVIREEGTNGDREMQAACTAAGLEAWDVTMSDLLAGRITLDQFQGIIFAGGFSFMDVFDSGKGWAATILFNERLREMFDRFYERPDTFSLGVCNGCQLMALLGWVPFKSLASEMQPRFIHNRSAKFESRWTQVEIRYSPSILFRGMEGSRLGIWVAHGEGQLIYPDHALEQEVIDHHLSPLGFIDPLGNGTEVYPYNPNGSPRGDAALCSLDGRHTAMMPHPERSFQLWQLPYMPETWRNLEAAPWLKMFQNAREWCMLQRA